MSDLSTKIKQLREAYERWRRANDASWFDRTGIYSAATAEWLSKKLLDAVVLYLPDLLHALEAREEKGTPAFTTTSYQVSTDERFIVRSPPVINVGYQGVLPGAQKDEGVMDRVFSFAPLDMGEASSLPERDPSKTEEQQGLFRKFIVQRVDGSDAPGGKHHGCEYFVIDISHDPYAPAALQAYAQACEQTHPQLSRDLLERFPPISSVVTSSGSEDAIKAHRAFFEKHALGPMRAPSCLVCGQSTQGKRLAFSTWSFPA